MIDFLRNPSALPAGRAASADPFGRFRPEDRWRLADDKVLGSNLGRRILGLPDRKPDRKPNGNRGASAVMADEAPAGSDAGRDFGPGYEAIPGWRVPLDADLKDLGLEALDNAGRAEKRPIPAAQVQTAERLRRAAGAAGTGANPAATGRTGRDLPRKPASSARPPASRRLRPGHRSTGAEGVFGIGGSGGTAGLPKTAPDTGRNRQPKAGDGGRPPLAGPAAHMTPAGWRALAGQLLHAREAIKQASIAAERAHGGNRQAHDDAVAATARREDAGLPGYTEHATVLSARRAGEKYLESRGRQADATAKRNEADAHRTTFGTFVREGRHALGKAEKALRAGNRSAAEGHKRDALLFLTNAKAAQNDARNAGIVPTGGPAPGAGVDGGPNESGSEAGRSESADMPPPDGAPRQAPAQKTRASAADRETPKKIGRKEALARLERQFVDGPAPLDAAVNRRILAAATAAYASAEARENAVGAAIRRAWRRDPAMRRKLLEAARAAGAGATEAERKRLFLEAAAGTTVGRTLEELTAAENRRVGRINEDRAGAAFDAWRRAHPEASETERLNKAVDLALSYGAAPAVLKTAVLRRFKDRLGVRRDRHGKMSVADPDATWDIYAALGRLYRHEPELGKALFPGIHGFVAESVAQKRNGWNAAENDPAARLDILKRVYLDAEKQSLREHEHGLHFLPIVGTILAAPETAQDIGNVFRRARDGDAGGALESLVQAALGVGFPAGRAAGKGAKGSKKKPADGGDPAAPRPETDGKRAPDPDGDFNTALAENESTGRYFREVEKDDIWRTRLAEKVPTEGAAKHKGKPIQVGGGRPDVLVGEVRLYKDGERAYALNLRGERVYNTHMPSRTDPNISWESAGDGGWLVTKRLADGRKLSVYYNPYGLPEFPARGAFWVAPEAIAKGGNAPRRYVKSQLKTMANSEAGRKKLKDMDFTAEQIEQMKQKANLDEIGIRLHHDYRVGRMLIVDRDLHDFAHQGGSSIW